MTHEYIDFEAMGYSRVSPKVGTTPWPWWAEELESQDAMDHCMSPLRVASRLRRSRQGRPAANGEGMPEGKQWRRTARAKRRR
jgi:hypothetical protein